MTSESINLGVSDSEFVKTFEYAIKNFDTDPRVVEGITKYVGFRQEVAIGWFTEMRKEWENNPPKSPEEASRLALRGAETSNCYGYFVDEMDPFLFYYGLPHYFEYMTAEERGLTICEQVGGGPYPDVDEELDRPWMGGGDVPDHVETFDNRITTTEGSDEPRDDSNCVDKFEYDIKNFDTDTKVVEKVVKYVGFHPEAAIAWFTEMRKEWENNPPKSPVAASRLALRGAKTTNCYGVAVDEMDPFLCYYGLPHYFEYEGRGLTIRGVPYPEVTEELEDVPDHVETFSNRIETTKVSDEPHGDSNCVEKLDYDIKNFDTDTKVVEKVAKHVGVHSDVAIAWFTEMRKEWANNPPKTPEEALRLSLRGAKAVICYGFDVDADEMDLFLSYYGLTRYFEYMTDVERGLTICELVGGGPYPEVSEELDKPWLGGCGVFGRVETVGNRISTTEGTNEHHIDSSYVFVKGSGVK